MKTKKPARPSELAGYHFSKTKFEIGYVTEDPAKEYGKAIRKAKNVQELVEAIYFYREVAPDALKDAKKMTKDDFDTFKKELPMMARKQTPERTEELVRRWGNIAIPRRLITVAIAAEHFCAPWGCVFIRLKELGKLDE